MDTVCNEDVVIPVCIVLLFAAIHQFNRRKQRKRWWARPWIKRRDQLGAYNALIKELSSEDPQSLKKFLRMDMDSFNKLLQLVDPLIRRKDTNMRNSISSTERLALTLRFLASGDSYESLQYLYRIPKSTASRIIPETCEAIYNVLKDEYLKVPDNPEAWKKVSDQFEEKWNFPHCIGAVDGKHVGVKCPPRSGSAFYNYKNYFSIIMLAVVDADYNILFVDVGCNGRANDSGIFNRSSFNKSLESNNLGLPTPEPLPDRHLKVPYVLVGDDAFTLKENIPKPYPNRQLTQEKRIFNYRLSRARRIVENVFGILANIFAIFQRTLSYDPDNVTVFILAACALHNFLRSKVSTRRLYTPDGSFDTDDKLGEWRCNTGASECFVNLVQQGGNRSRIDYRDTRDEFCDYFCSNCQVPWQWQLV